MKKKILFALTISLNLIMAVVVVFIGLNAAKNPGEESVEHENGIKLATTATSKSKNLILLADTEPITENGITYYVNNNIIYYDGISTANFKVFLPLIHPLPVGTYSSCTREEPFASGDYLDGVYYSSVDTSFENGFPDEYTQTTSEIIRYIGIEFVKYSYSGSFKPMVVEGSVIPTTYEPYAPTQSDIVSPYPGCTMTQTDWDYYIGHPQFVGKTEILSECPVLQNYALFDSSYEYGNYYFQMSADDVIFNVDNYQGESFNLDTNCMKISDQQSNVLVLFEKTQSTVESFSSVEGIRFIDLNVYLCDSSEGDALEWLQNARNLMAVVIPSNVYRTAVWYPSEMSTLYLVSNYDVKEVDRKAPVPNVPATYVVNVDNMESLDNILKHVTVSDDTDPTPLLIVKSSSYNASNRVCGTFPVTIYAQDASGNVSADVTFNVMVVDTTSPTIAVKTGLTESNYPNELMTDDELIHFLFDISDNYDSFDDLTIQLNRSEYNSSNYHMAGTKEISVEVYDRAGNFSDAFTTLLVVDDIKPTINASNKEVGNNVQLSEEELLSLFTVSDETSVANKITKIIVENTYSKNWNKVGSYQVTCEAKDEAGNTNRTTSTISVLDAIPPQATVTAIRISYTHKLTDEEILAHVTATDDQVATPTITLDRAAYDASYAKVGSYVIVVNVSDGSNAVKKELPVNVIDDVKPVIVGPSVVTVGNSTMLTIAELKSKFTVTDAIDGTIDFTIEDLNGYAGSYTKVSKYEMKVIATDAAGNTNTFITTMDVKDDTSPTILYGQYFIVLQEGEELTDEMIKAYASKVFNVSLESIVSIEGDYNVEKAGTYSLMVALEDGTKQSLTVSVSDNPSEGEVSTKPEAKFELKHFFSADISNWTEFDSWPAWSICVWLIWFGIGLGSIVAICLVVKFMMFVRKLLKG